MGIYFTCFETLKKRMSHDPHGSWSEKLKVMMAGGAAGLASWVFLYPLDFVKTKLQSQDIENRVYRGSWHCFRTNLKEHGWKVFTRGLVTVSLRSFPVNAMGFLA